MKKLMLATALTLLPVAGLAQSADSGEATYAQADGPRAKRGQKGKRGGKHGRRGKAKLRRMVKVLKEVGVSDATYYNWRRRFGGMGKSQLSELRGLEKENARLKKIVAELELDKLILKESLDFLKPKA